MRKSISEDECLCTETNIESLKSEIDAIINSPRSKRVDEDAKEKNFDTDSTSKNCKCHEIFSHYFSEVSETHAKSVSEKQSSHRELKRAEQQSMTEPAVDHCVCRNIDPYIIPLKSEKNEPCKKPLWCLFNWKWPQKEYYNKHTKRYEVKLKPEKHPHYKKPFVCCEITGGKSNKQKFNKHNKVKHHSKRKDKDIAERIDIYYFDHGNSAYYRTTDSPPIVISEKCAEKTDEAATRFWAEIFGTIHIGTAFVTSFILQLLRFVLYSILRPLTVGIIQLLGDYFLKPFLSIVFNAIIQPVLILLYNIATSLRDLCEPLAEALGLFLKEIANICQAIRLVEIKQTNCSSHPVS